MLSLAFQRSFPRVFDHVERLTALREQDKGEGRRLRWPSWCAFPVGLALDVLRQHYGYDRDGVEPALLAALAGWRGERASLLLTREDVARGERGPEWNEVPTGELRALPWSCLYVEYPEGLGVLGAFLFLDWNGPGQESLVMVAQCELYRVEPIVLPLEPSGTLGDMSRALARILDPAASDRLPSDPATVDLLRTVLPLARANLGLLSAACGAGRAGDQARAM